MSFSLEPNKGLRLKLGRFSPIRTWQGGGNFWSHEFQLTVRSGALAAFLPRAIEDEDTVLFEHRGGGMELASTSTAVSSPGDIPVKELKALRAAVDELKRKAEDPHCDRTKRRMIEGFRLPDPQKDRDLYRLIGKGFSARLIVLWGVEREEGSALAPGAAVDLMHTPAARDDGPAPGPVKKSRLVPVLLALLLLAALGGGGWYYHAWQQEQEKKRLEQEAAALAAAQAEKDRIAAFNAQAAADAAPAEPSPAPGTPAASTDPAPPTVSATPPAPGAPTPSPAPGSPTTPQAPPPGSPPLPEGTVVKDGAGVIAGIVDKDGALIPAEPGVVLDGSGKTVTPAKPGDLVKDAKGGVTGVVDGTGKVTPVTPGKVVDATPGKPVTGPPGALVRDPKGTVTGVLDKDGKVVPARPGVTADKDGKVTSAPPGSVFRDEKGVVTGITNKDGKVIPARPVPVVRTATYHRQGTGTPAPGQPPAPVTTSRPPPGPATTQGPPAGPVTSKGPPSGAVTTQGPPPGPVITQGPSSGPITTQGPPPSSVTTRMTTQGPPPAGISSLSVVSTSLSGVLGNGNVEVLLNVVARDMSGTVVNAPPIHEWKVDGIPQSRADGKPADGPVLPVSLSPGAHKISTSGTGSDGQRFQTDADVMVIPKP